MVAPVRLLRNYKFSVYFDLDQICLYSDLVFLCSSFHVINENWVWIHAQHVLWFSLDVAKVVFQHIIPTAIVQHLAIRIKNESKSTIWRTMNTPKYKKWKTRKERKICLYFKIHLEMLRDQASAEQQHYYFGYSFYKVLFGFSRSYPWYKCINAIYFMLTCKPLIHNTVDGGCWMVNGEDCNRSERIHRVNF